MKTKEKELLAAKLREVEAGLDNIDDDLLDIAYSAKLCGLTALSNAISANADRVQRLYAAVGTLRHCIDSPEELEHWFRD